PLAVVGEEQKWDVLLPQLLDEVIRAGDEFGPAVKHPVHVDEIAVFHGCPLRFHAPVLAVVTAPGRKQSPQTGINSVLPGCLSWSGPLFSGEGGGRFLPGRGWWEGVW